MGGYSTYRIPAVLQTGTKGVVLVFAEGRKLSSADHGWNDIVQRRSTDNGRTFTQGMSVVHGESNATTHVTIGNPAPILDAVTGRVWMLFSRNNKGVGAMWSDDTGLSWLGPRDLNPELMAPNKWTDIFTGLSAGTTLPASLSPQRRLIVCANHDGPPLKGDPNPKRAGRYSSSIYSDDRGATWHGGAAVGPGGSTECNVAATSAGVFIYSRMWDQPAGKPTYGMAGPSLDGGATFNGSFTAAGMGMGWPQPDCEGTMQVVAAPSGPDCFVLTAPYGHARANMTLSYSCGATPGVGRWAQDRVLWPGPAAYSSLEPSSDGETFFVAYERGSKGPYETVQFTQIRTPAWH